MITQLIEELSDVRQQKAIREYPRCVVVAGPGSGKTYRLVLKIAYLLGQEIADLQGIACITYMNDAVREIEDRVSRLGFEDEQRLFVGTVHKFCISAIILPFKDIFLKDWPSEIKIADQEKQLEIISKAYLEMGHSIPSRTYEIREHLRGISEYRIGQLFETAGTHSLQRFAEVYLQILREHGLVDFDDIAIEACRLIMTESEVCDYIGSRYSWLVIDEYQDLGRVFNALITHLVACTNINFFVVGDANQSIMGFQGADSSYLLKLAEMGGVEKVNIQITRRCLPHIIDVANQLLPLHSPRVTTLHENDETKKVKIEQCPRGIQEQIEAIIREVQNLHHDQSVPYGDIAILCRNTDTIRQLATTLSSAKIEYSGKEDGRYPRTPLTRWLEDVAAWLRTGWAIGTPKFQRIHREYRRFLETANIVPYIDHTELAIQTLFLNTLWDCRYTNQLVSDWLFSLTQNLFLDKIAEALAATEPYNANGFWELSEATQPNQRLEHLTVADLALCGRSENSVFLSTLHSSKGLEFDAVIIPDLEQGRLPDWRAKTPEQIAEERRLLFVGITRAKTEIMLLYSGYYILPWNAPSQDGPSQFLRELGLL